MRIEELHIQNFRGFKGLTVKFPADLAVIIGSNGSGKSSLLDCIAMLLALFESRLTGGKKRQVRLTDRDINITSKSTTINLIVVTKDGERLRWSISRDYVGEDRKTQTQDIRLYIDNLHEELDQNPNASLPIAIYYQTSRNLLNTSLESSKPNKHSLYVQFLSYENAFTSGTNNFQDFFNWFRSEEDYENEIRLRQDHNYRNPNLEVIREAIKKFLEEFPNSNFSNIRIERKKGNRDFDFGSKPVETSFVITKNDQDLEIEQLSAGEKMLLMLVVDIARRLAIANPGKGREALEGKGIILIDEVDLHLHPQWQRVVIQGLRRTFPDCQFIVTTHSPQVLSKVKKENVLVLEDGQIWKSDAYTFGRDSNSILSELMDVEERPVEIKNQLNRCFHLIDDGKIEDAKALLGELSNLLGERDSEIVRAYTLIDFLSRIEPESNEAHR